LRESREAFGLLQLAQNLGFTRIIFKALHA
jgi:hypothetical protein